MTITLVHSFFQQIFIKHLCIVWSFPAGSVVKNLSGNAGYAGGMQETCRRHGFYPWVGRIPWSRKWHPISVSLPGKFAGERSPSTWGQKELDTTEHTELVPTHIFCTKRYFPMFSQMGCIIEHSIFSTTESLWKNG